MSRLAATTYELTRAMAVVDARRPDQAVQLAAGTRLAVSSFATWGEAMDFHASLAPGHGIVLRVESGRHAGTLVRLTRRDDRRLRGARVEMQRTDCPEPLDQLTQALRSPALLAAADQRLRTAATLAWLHFDIDGFSEYNLEHGYHAGDALLQRLAAGVRASLPADSLARDGSDEFILIGTPDASRRPAVAAVAAGLGITLEFDAGEASSLAELVDQLGF